MRSIEIIYIHALTQRDLGPIESIQIIY